MKTLNNRKQLALVAVTLLGVAGFAAGAQANEAYFAANTVTVRYSDLNLDTSTGADMLYRRIEFAAKQVCGDDGVKPIAQAAAIKACVNRTVVANVRAVDRAQLTRAVNAHGYAVPTSFITAAIR